ncbi:MAG: tetratricopeptide repeat protein, partial [Gemmatimonadetes bacterium]|nr:tetratricopeptide repeat protein [Gemmatimonadota bacterium]
IGLAVIAAIVVIWMLANDRSGMQEERSLPGYGEDRSIAVLPFVDLSPDEGQEYFSDGMSVELIGLLREIPQLRVTPRTSAFAFKGQNLGIPEIARQLNVEYILEGSVRQAGNNVRIDAQLIDGHSDEPLWSDTWDREFDDIFEIQNEIAAEVVSQLQLTMLGTAPTVEETDPEAYAFLLQARHLGHQLTDESLEQSNRLYEQALEIDPDYAAAWTGLSGNYPLQARFGRRPLDESYQLSRDAANRALAIDPEYAPAKAQLGVIAMAYDRDLAAAARHLEQALALEPTNPVIISAAATLLSRLGRLDEGIALSEYVVARDPVNAFTHGSLGLYYLIAGRPDEAVESLRTALTLSPHAAWMRHAIGVSLIWRGEPEAALAVIQQESVENWKLMGLAVAYHALGRAAESEAALNELIDNYEPGWAYHIALVTAFRGEADRAFEWLDRAAEYNEPLLGLIAVAKLADNIHDDPRWLPFLESIGYSPEQLAAIEFEVRLPE